MTQQATKESLDEVVETESNNQIKCDMCEFVAPNKNSMGKHKDASHKQRRCTTCSLVFRSSKDLNVHIQQKHSAGGEENDKEDSNLQIKCEKCSFIARNEAIMEKHQEMYHTNVKCKACSQVFRSNDDMEIHLVQKHSDEADCKKCNSFFKTERDVMNHANNCYEVLPLNICNKCEREVISKGALKNHEPSCSGKKKKQEIVCRNGKANNCQWAKQGRCRFWHSDLYLLQRQPEVQRPSAPNNQWQQVPLVQQQSQNKNIPQSAQAPPAQPWCRYGLSCNGLGSYCVLRHYSDQDFLQLQGQMRN